MKEQKITRIPLKYAPLISTLSDETVGRIFKKILYIDENLYDTENMYFELMMNDINEINKKAGDGNKGGRPRNKPKVIKNDNLRLLKNDENTKPSKDKIRKDKIRKDKIIINNGAIKKDFEEFWNLYPVKKGKQKAEKKYLELIRGGIKHDTMIKGITDYIKEYKLLIKMGRFCPEYKHPVTRLNQGCWADEYKTEMRQYKEKKYEKPKDTHFIDDLLGF